MMYPCECEGVTTYDDGYLVPGTETSVDSQTFKADPGPAGEE
jgi:hypothetical protein